MAQLAVEKGVEVSQDGTVYSEFLEQIRSQPKVARAVKQAQKSLPHDVFASIEAMFSGASQKDDVFETFFESRVSKQCSLALVEKALTHRML